MLPDSHRWIQTDRGAALYQNYKCIAVVHEGRVEIRWLGGKVGGPCGSARLGVRYVERWLAAQYDQGARMRRAARALPVAS